MLHNPTFNTPKIREFIIDLIDIYHYQTFSDLSPSDISALAALFIEASDDEHDFLVESSNFAEIMRELKLSLLGTSRDNSDLLNALKEAPISYYNKSMESMFEHCYDIWVDRMNEYHLNIFQDDHYEDRGIAS